MRRWKVFGLAGLASAAVTGALAARAERRRRSSTVEDDRAGLGIRMGESDAVGRAGIEDSARPRFPRHEGTSGSEKVLDMAVLLRACAAGQAIQADGQDLLIEAHLVRELCRRGREEMDPRGLVIEGARIRGDLDLSGMEVPFPLRFVGCVFDRPVNLDGADLHLLVFDTCTVPGILANGLRVRRDLDLSRSRITGDLWTSASTSCTAAVWLCESEIGGRLLCLDTVIESAMRAMQADRMRVGGSIRLLHDFEARGAMRLLGVQVEGSLDLTGARLTGSERGLALNLGDARIGGSVFLIDDQTGRRPLVRGRIGLGNARISGQFLIRNAIFEPTEAVRGVGYSSSRSGGTAVSAPGLFIGGDLSVEGECQISGGMDLSMGSFSTIRVQRGCEFTVGGGHALDLTNAELRSSLVIEEGAAIQGTLRLVGAHIKGNLTLQGTRWSQPVKGSLIAAEGVVIESSLDLRGVEAVGGRLRFRSATVGGIVDAHGARLRNPGGEALSLQRVVVRGSILLSGGFLAEGRVLLNRCIVEGQLDCEGGTFAGGIEAVSATARGGMRLRWTEVPPLVDLTGASTTVLTDDPARWPRDSAIAGFVYDRFDGIWDWRARRDWLRAMSSFDAGPYEQAARVFRQHGRPGEAERLLIEQRRQARRASGSRGRSPGQWIRNALDLLYGLSVGYGYRPGRALWLLGALLALVGIMMLSPVVQQTLRATDPRGNVYAVDGRLITVDAVAASGDATATAARRGGRPGPCGDGQVRCFDPLFYTVDTVVPLMSLGQRATWYPETHSPHGLLISTLLNVASLLGWLLSTVVVLSFARLARPA
ncbi:hypothetical protein N5079_32265 [Planotetraspora sp. A-T 1434]|uniref:hypothetical protein n=1 Tax=Planotetraspora sp. A-T 1434 TaxID=2979219 RepID=UPI0021C047B7|nr:hypothetical protein [Planotetraspora sp. A-T 1434]MCT9934892.1 hypothetical protein [Planotetraspora sp. A-T 1434]